MAPWKATGKEGRSHGAYCIMGTCGPNLGSKTTYPPRKLCKAIDSETGPLPPMLDVHTLCETMTGLTKRTNPIQVGVRALIIGCYCSRWPYLFQSWQMSGRYVDVLLSFVATHANNEYAFRSCFQKKEEEEEPTPSNTCLSNNWIPEPENMLQFDNDHLTSLHPPLTTTN